MVPRFYRARLQVFAYFYYGFMSVVDSHLKCRVFSLVALLARHEVCGAEVAVLRVLQQCDCCCHESVLLALKCPVGFCNVLRHVLRLIRDAVGLGGYCIIAFFLRYKDSAFYPYSVLIHR